MSIGEDVGRTLGGLGGSAAGAYVSGGVGTVAGKEVGESIGATVGKEAEERAKSILGDSPPFDEVIDYLLEHSCTKTQPFLSSVSEDYQLPLENGMTLGEMYVANMIDSAQECDLDRLLDNTEGFTNRYHKLFSKISVVSNACDWGDKTLERAIKKATDKKQEVFDNTVKEFKDHCKIEVK